MTEIRYPNEATASRWVGEMRPIRVLSGTGDGTVMDEGHVLGYIDVPSIVVLRADGSQCAWSTRLPFEVTGPPTPDDRQAELLAQRGPRGSRPTNRQSVYEAASAAFHEADEDGLRDPLRAAVDAAIEAALAAAVDPDDHRYWSNYHAPYDRVVTALVRALRGEGFVS